MRRLLLCFAAQPQALSQVWKARLHHNMLRQAQLPDMAWCDRFGMVSAMLKLRCGYCRNGRVGCSSKIWGHDQSARSKHPEANMITKEDDFDSELEQTRRLLSRSLGREEEPEQSGELYRLQREAGPVSGSADESFLAVHSGKANTLPPL